jgi:hypothetical protein
MISLAGFDVARAFVGTLQLKLLTATTAAPASSFANATFKWIEAFHNNATRSSGSSAPSPIRTRMQHDHHQSERA